MDEDSVGRGQPRMGGWLGDYEDLVGHEGHPDREAPRVRKLWNPVTYRCAFCGESFVSRAMIRRHLERHAARNATARDADSIGEAVDGGIGESVGEAVDERKAA